jgi:hypothetical protein
MGWSTEEVAIGSAYSYSGDFDKMRIKFDDADEAMEEMNENPGLYQGVFNLWNQHIWLIKRGITFTPDTAKPQNGCTWTTTVYDTGLGDGSNAFEDEYSEGVLASFKGQDISGSLKRVGRGQGILDIEGLEVIQNADPGDVFQGGIGDCWLMSSMSAVAEFAGMLEKNFETHEVNEEGEYTVKLFCLASKEWKTYVIDDRLFTANNKLRFGGASPDGEIWSPLLEKAFAIHADGWDNLVGGYPIVGISAITGCTDSFIIQNCNKSVSEFCDYTYRIISPDWDSVEGNHAGAFGGLYSAKWDNGEREIDGDAFFDYICEWDEAGYIMCAGTGRPGTSGNHDNDNQGIADSHAYALVRPRRMCAASSRWCASATPGAAGSSRAAMAPRPGTTGGRCGMITPRRWMSSTTHPTPMTACSGWTSRMPVSIFGASQLSRLTPTARGTRRP